jgi:hypothetical protein
MQWVPSDLRFVASYAIPLGTKGQLKAPGPQRAEELLSKPPLLNNLTWVVKRVCEVAEVMKPLDQRPPAPPASIAASIGPV